MQFNKKTLAISLTLISLSSANADLIENTDITLKIGMSKQNFMFDTPAAHSILEWQGENVNTGVDIKHNFTDNFFTDLELDYSKVKGGQAHDDDITNRGGVYSKGGIEGRTKDLKLNFGYKFNINSLLNIDISPTIGGFYKNINFISENNYQLSYMVVNAPPYGNVPITRLDYFAGIANETNTTIYGASFGLKFENQHQEDADKLSLRIDYLLPISYQGEQIWHKRTPILHWQLENRKTIDPANNYGFRVKLEQSYKIDSYILDYIKLYSSYEQITIQNLKETAPSYSYEGKGRADFQSFTVGMGLEF